MSYRRAVGLAFAVVAVAAGATAPPAHAVASCAFAAGSGELTITSPGGGDQLVVRRGAGGAILMNGSQACGATVANTDRVSLQGGSGVQRFTVDLGGGAFAPGRTTEAAGFSEIEFAASTGDGFEFPLGDVLAVAGTAAADALRFGVDGIAVNGDGDADITAAADVEEWAADGLGGDDQLLGSGGAGTGASATRELRLRGGGGADDLVGGSDDDVLEGGPGDDDERGGGGSDTFRQGAFADGADRLDGEGTPFDRVDYAQRTSAVRIDLDNAADDGATGEGDNVIDSFEYADSGGGGDTLIASQTKYLGVQFTAGPGNDTLTGGSAGDLLQAGTGNDTIAGNASSDSIYGGPGNDVERGGDGDDRFYESNPTPATTSPFANGRDDVFGGAGSDLVAMEYRTAPLTITLNDGQFNDGAAGEGDNLRTDLEELRGGAAADVITGNVRVNRIEGRGGADRIAGGSGADVIGGGPGRDRLDGGADPDQLDGDEDDDTLLGGTGGDKLVGDYGGDLLDAGTGADDVRGELGDDVMPQPIARDEADKLEGGDGTDAVSYSGRSGDVKVTLDALPNDGDATGTSEGDDVRAEKVTGGAGDDELTGDGQPNHLLGGLGDDQLRGGDGDDRLDGGGGADLMDGEGHRDLADYSLRTADLTVRLDGDTGNADGEPGEGDTVMTEDVTGGSAEDALTGNGLRNVLDGGPGDDTLDGDDGPDVLTGGDGADTADYGQRSAPVAVRIDTRATDGTDADRDGIAEEGDLVAPSVENVDGGGGDDWLRGSVGANRLRGDFGDDRLDGLSGPDVLEGGVGQRDTADYGLRTVALAVDVDNDAGDGQDANRDGIGEEGDRVHPTTERVVGGAGPDRLRASLTYESFLEGRGGDDELSAYLGANDFRGGPGFDSVRYDLSPTHYNIKVTIDDVADDGPTRSGDDNVHTDVEGVVGDDGRDELRGSSADNVLIGGGGNDDLYGNGGEDRFDERAFSAGDNLYGGTGVDVADYSGRDVPLKISIDEAFNDGAADEADNVRNDVEEVRGGEGADLLVGDGGGNRLLGGPGADRLEGRDGNDVLSGGGGDDLAFGEGGSDELSGQQDGNVLDGGPGDDAFPQGDWGMGGDRLIGGAGQDTADYSQREVSVILSNDGSFEDWGDQDGYDADGDTRADEGDRIMDDVEVLKGGAVDDWLFNGRAVDDGCAVLFGGGGPDRLFGRLEGATREILHGGPGIDTLTARGGNDFLIGGPADDTELGGEGDDQFVQGAFSGSCGAYSWGYTAVPDGADVLDGEGGADHVDYRRTTPVRVQIDLNAGDGANNGTEGDRVVAEAVSGGSAGDVLIGDGGDNKLYGWAGDDVLDGSGGNDLLEDVSGIGDLTGGEGNDTFSAADGDNADTLRGGPGTDGGQWDAGDTRIEIP